MVCPYKNRLFFSENRLARRSFRHSPLTHWRHHNAARHNAQVMPRPQKNHSDRRTRRVEIRLTSAEEKSLAAHASDDGLTVSDFIRKAALGSKPRIQQANPERAVLIRLLAELGKVGSNVNQIAKALNTDLAKGQKATVPGEVIASALQVVQTLSAHLIKTLTHGDTR